MGSCWENNLHDHETRFGVFMLMRQEAWWWDWNQEKGNGIELGKSDWKERESREKRDYGGERERDRERVCLFGGEIEWMENFEEKWEEKLFWMCLVG